jgi:hypothetical protein
MAGGGIGVTATLVSLHVASNAEGLSASCVWALVRLLSGVRVRVDPQAARSGEGLAARLADVSILRLREGSLAGVANVVMMLPRIRGRGRAGRRDRGRRRRERGRERTLVVQGRPGGVLMRVGRREVGSAGGRVRRSHVRARRVRRRDVGRGRRMRGGGQLPRRQGLVMRLDSRVGVVGVIGGRRGRRVRGHSGGRLATVNDGFRPHGRSGRQSNIGIAHTRSLVRGLILAEFRLTMRRQVGRLPLRRLAAFASR